MKIIAIGGEPASGKTTLVKRILLKLKAKPEYESVKFIPYLKKDNIFILGKYQEGVIFSGTDTMSMAVQPHAIKFLEQISNKSVVIFEGDRLFNSSFLHSCVKKYFTKIIYLSTKAETRQQRYRIRGSNQNKTWLNGRETKIKNILKDPILSASVVKFSNNTEQEQDKAFEYIFGKIESSLKTL